MRLMTLISSNDGFDELGVRMGRNTKGAVAARMVTLDVSRDGPLRALDRVPVGFASVRAAIQALHNAVALHYGAAGHALVARLVAERAADEPRLRRRIARRLEKFNRLTGAGELTGGDARASKLFALVYVAWCLARRWGILPKAWGRPSVVVRKVYAAWRASGETGAEAGRAAQLLWSALEPSRPRWVAAVSVMKPLERADFQAAAGRLMSDGKGRALLVPASALQSSLKNCAEVMRELRDAGVVEGEAGRQRKLTRKAPRSLTRGRERVYRIKLDRLEELIARGQVS